jgi:hypothetical protein
MVVRNVAAIVFAAALATSPAVAQPTTVADPGKFAADTMQSLATKGTQEAAATILNTIGRAGALDAFRASLAPLEGKKYDFVRKVIDKDYEAALRQIVYYAHVDGAGFMYFRYNFKMTGDGWKLVNFTFKEEANELFPRDFLDR